MEISSVFRRGTEGRERGIICETKIELRGSSAENVFVIATYRARRVYLEYSFPVSHHNTLLLHSDRTLLIVHNACTEGERTRTAWCRKILTKIWQLGMFSSFRSNSIFASTCNSINSLILLRRLTSVPLLQRCFPDSVWTRLNVRRWRRCSAKFTGEEDVITPVNYFVVEEGDVRAKNTNPLTGEHFHKKFTACFADQRERNEIILERERERKS